MRIAAIALVASGALACGTGDDVSIGREQVAVPVATDNAVPVHTCIDGTCKVDAACSLRVGDCASKVGVPAAGTCPQVPDACPTQNEPVCGCDGASYDSPCLAASSMTGVASVGPCPSNDG